ncbi:FG-GAP repeat domain-containing protein [Flavitalea flava]
MIKQNQFWVCTFLAGIVWLCACRNDIRNRKHQDIPMSSIREGEHLAGVYCKGCHLLPDPSMLDTRSWETGVLPNMGPHLGIFNHEFQRYPSSIRDTNVGRKFYPSQPLLTADEWQHILDYYISTSPDSLPAQAPHPEIKNKLSLFTAVIPSFRYPDPATCLTRTDTSGTTHSLLVFDVHSGGFYRFSPSLQLLDSIHTPGAIVDLSFEASQGIVACNMGMLNPHNGKLGKGQFIRISGAGEAGVAGKLGGPDEKMQMDTVPLFDHLARPVQLTAADLNQDGLTDYLVCEYGNLTGALSWMENKAKGHFERHVIRAVAGAIKAVIGDFNHDGLPDIMALFAQGDEGIFLFTNEGKGRFNQQVLLRFPPMYGSSYFELADFNKDGFPDILYTCGDNADYSAVLKPYHGVYIFMNDGRNHFNRQYFFPINGCYKAMARDFDGDGDLDIATISFFPDFEHHPEEGFVYLENLGGLKFQPFSLPETQSGKWLTMDAADLDGDGKTDIVLGNFSYFSTITKAGVDFTKGPPFILLKNMGK